jgi:hypothetical protein
MYQLLMRDINVTHTPNFIRRIMGGIRRYSFVAPNQPGHENRNNICLPELP